MRQIQNPVRQICALLNLLFLLFINLSYFLMLNFQIAEFIPRLRTQQNSQISYRYVTPTTASNTGNEHRAYRDGR